jgi:putative transposase
MYLTIVMDLWSREIVGWSFSRTMKTHETTIPALRMAIKQRGVHQGFIFQSDRVAFNTPTRSSENYAPSIASFTI